LQTVIIAFICFVLLAGVGTMIYFRITSKPSQLGAGVDNQLHNHNLSFDRPARPGQSMRTPARSSGRR